LQFAFISVIALPVPLFTAGSQNNGKGSVPMTRWAYIAFLFYSINMLNNWAFAFNISVPVHIILRSFGSVTTMLAGVVRGKRYSKLQVTSVVILTVGAWADSMSKVRLDFEVRCNLGRFTDHIDRANR
jgi:UDP-xylose/UDP-N-acetylglucosamine transporter B4